MIQLCSCLSQNSGFNCPGGVTMTWELLCNSLMYSDQYPGMIMKIVVMMPGTWQHCLWSHHHPSLIMKTRETCQDILLALLLYHQAMSYIDTVHNFPFTLYLICKRTSQNGLKVAKAGHKSEGRMSMMADRHDGWQLWFGEAERGAWWHYDWLA